MTSAVSKVLLTQKEMHIKHAMSQYNVHDDFDVLVYGYHNHTVQRYNILNTHVVVSIPPGYRTLIHKGFEYYATFPRQHKYYEVYMPWVHLLWNLAAISGQGTGETIPYLHTYAGSWQPFHSSKRISFNFLPNSSCYDKSKFNGQARILTDEEQLPEVFNEIAYNSFKIFELASNEDIEPDSSQLLDPMARKQVGSDRNIRHNVTHALNYWSKLSPAGVYKQTNLSCCDRNDFCYTTNTNIIPAASNDRVLEKIQPELPKALRYEWRK